MAKTGTQGGMAMVWVLGILLMWGLMDDSLGATLAPAPQRTFLRSVAFLDFFHSDLPTGNRPAVCMGVFAQGPAWGHEVVLLTAAHCFSQGAKLKALVLPQGWTIPIGPHGVSAHPAFPQNLPHPQEGHWVGAVDQAVVRFDQAYTRQLGLQSLPLASPPPLEDWPLSSHHRALLQNQLEGYREPLGICTQVVLTKTTGRPPNPNGEGGASSIPYDHLDNHPDLLFVGNGFALEELCQATNVIPKPTPLQALFENICQGMPPGGFGGQRVQWLKFAGWHPHWGFGVAVAPPQGRVGIGESGAPLLSWQGDRWVVAGLASWGADELTQIIGFSPLHTGLDFTFYGQ